MRTIKYTTKIGLIANAIQVIRNKEENKVLFFGYPTLLKEVKVAIQELNNHLTSRCRSIDKMDITGRQAFRLETRNDPFKSFLREWYSEGQDPCGWIMRLPLKKLAEILLKHNFIEVVTLEEQSQQTEEEDCASIHERVEENLSLPWSIEADMVSDPEEACCEIFSGRGERLTYNLNATQAEVMACAPEMYAVLSALYLDVKHLMRRVPLDYYMSKAGCILDKIHASTDKVANRDSHAAEPQQPTSHVYIVQTRWNDEQGEEELVCNPCVFATRELARKCLALEVAFHKNRGHLACSSEKFQTQVDTQDVFSAVMTKHEECGIDIRIIEQNLVTA